MSKKNLKILKTKLNEINLKIDNSIKNNVPLKKREELELLKLKYETELEELLLL